MPVYLGLLLVYKSRLLGRLVAVVTRGKEDPYSIWVLSTLKAIRCLTPAAGYRFITQTYLFHSKVYSIRLKISPSAQANVFH